MTSSPPRRWADLGTLGRVGVWGVGVEGRATLARITQMGIEPSAVVDDKPVEDRVLATARGGLDALLECAIVVKSPGIGRYTAAVGELEAAGVEVVGGLGLWLEDHGAERVIGITGTKGKSTTTAIADHLARALGVRSAAGGNIGMVPWSPDAPADVDLWIVEISSYQATDLWSSPPVVVVTSLHEDHLTWHADSAERYFDDKLSLCGKPGAVITVANGEDLLLRERAEHLRPGPRWVELAEKPEPSWTRPLGLRGRHNELNALLAAACLEEAGVGGADDPERLRNAAVGYRHLPHRLETIAVLDEVEFVDDSLSTNVLPTIAAVEVFNGRPLALLAGGYDRGIDYRPLGDFVARRAAPTLVVTLPQNGGRILAAVEAAGGQAVASGGMVEAVTMAAKWAPAGGVVLLSPAAASFEVYPNYLARSADFAASVAALGGETTLRP